MPLALVVAFDIFFLLWLGMALALLFPRFLEMMTDLEIPALG